VTFITVVIIGIEQCDGHTFLTTCFS